MYLAPFGVGAAIAVTIGSKGIGVLLGFGQTGCSPYISAQALFVVLVLGAALAHCAHSIGPFYPGRPRSLLVGVFDRIERGRPSFGARKYGAHGHSKAYRRFRAADRL